jgi:hypothetical protein
MQFDNNGYLQPYKAITSNVNEIVNEFCFTEQRTLLYQNFVALIAELQTLLGIDFEVWVNGSFISKKPVPNDIDLVVFVDFTVFENVERELAKFRTLEYRNTNFLDCYFVREYPKEHKNYFRYEFDKTEYLHLFSKNRRKQEKGFLSIVINS